MTQNMRIEPRRRDSRDVRPFTTTTIVGHDAQTVYVAGELDLSSNAEATAAFTIAVGTGLPIIVDLTDLDFMDCGGYRAIGDACHVAEQHRITLTITHARGEPARLLSLFGEHRRGTAAALLDSGSC